jgi:hypothetical protein
MRTLLHKEMMMDEEEELEPQEYFPLSEDEIMMLGYYFEYATAYIRKQSSLTGKLDPSAVTMLN